jgi:hypothetical protein
MNVHLIADQGSKCECGAAIHDNDHHTLCPKCRARARWQRRTEGRRLHPRQQQSRRFEGR